MNHIEIKSLRGKEMKQVKPLNDLEMYEVIKLAYSDKFPEIEGDDWDDVMDFVECELGGFEELSEILGRIVRLAPVMQSPITGEAHHCLGDVVMKDGQASITAAVKREYVSKN